MNSTARSSEGSPGQATRTGQGPARAGGRRPTGRSRPARRVPVDPARKVAYRTLRAVAERDAYANLVLPSLLRREGLHGRDAAFATELACGALRGKGTYDAVLAACSDRPLDQVDPPVLDVLRLGTHQLLGTRVPAHAAVAATVDLVRSELGGAAAGFVNAVLRKVCVRGQDAWLARIVPPDADEDTVLSLTTSHPGWIVRALRDALRSDGRDPRDLPDVLAANNVRPQVGAVALPGLSTVSELRAAGAHPGTLSPLAVTLTGAPHDLSAVAQGRARIQDEGSQIVALALAGAELIGPDRGRWSDLCAGPGGKAALLGAVLARARHSGDLPPDACLLAVENVEHRVRLVRGAIEPLLKAQKGTVEVRHLDGRELVDEVTDLYDRVLVDVPCTGLGALRRRPEARWRRTPADLATLGPLQRSLLDTALRVVRPGGVVAYVTCSPHPAETRLVVADALRGREDVELLDARPVVAEVCGSPVIGPEQGHPDLQLWPDLHGTDAMYLALLRRRPVSERPGR
jgi:16S rRNA (cytosine967-C5)-methyltransferase